MVVVVEAPFALAVRVADCALLTGAAVTLKLAVVAPAPTVTETGSVIDGLLLASVIRIGFGAADSRLTEHA